MANDEKLKLSEEKEKNPSIQCNIHNPNRGRRVIYDGIEGSQKSIVIEGGETKYNVTLSKRIAEELRDRNRAKPNSDLVVGPPTEPPPPPPQPVQPEPRIA